MEFKIFKEMLRRVLLGTFVAAAFACSAKPVDQKLVEGLQNIKPDQQQSLVVKEVVGLIENFNYKKIKVNDSISSIILDRYIKSLDPSRYYFLESDIKEFEQFRTTLDDSFRDGDLSAPFYIFNVYLKRYNDRIDFSLAQVNQKFDFNQNDNYTYDRERMPWINSKVTLDDVWKKRIKYELLNLKLASSDMNKNIETLKKRYENLRSQAAKFNNQDVFQIVMDSFTEAIDPHTNYLNFRNAEVFNQEMSRSIEGIGATLQLENEVTKIVSIVPGGPAFKSKAINAGDRIIAVAQGENGEFEDIVGWRIDNAVSKIKGPKGTTVRLKVIPSGQELTAKPVVISLVREKVILEEQSAKKTVKTVMNDGAPIKVGIIAIPAFYADFKAASAGDPNYKSTTRDVRLILDTLKNIDKVDALVIDLRGNGGGSLVEAIDLTGLFIDQGPVVQVKNSRNEVQVNEDKVAGVSWNGPLGVMVDRLSASASEIFAGAIQDYGRGIIMGTQTFGKGTVQSSIDMNRLFEPTFLQRISAALKPKPDAKEKSTVVVDKDGIVQFGIINLTMAKFYRVNGNSTQHKGVIPDISFPSIYPLDKIGEDTEPSALPFDIVKASNYTPVGDLSAIKMQLLRGHEERMKNSVDYAVLLENIEEGKKRDAQTAVTLNEAKLKKEREIAEEKALANVNKVRVARGLKSLAKGEKPSEKDDIDFMQEESLRIMADLIKHNNQDSKMTRLN
ncbi:MAG: tail-specific protease [Pedobacter sp.]|nr:MAG: tail-specific protease [Pedobacter sp.]